MKLGVCHILSVFVSLSTSACASVVMDDFLGGPLTCNLNDCSPNSIEYPELVPDDMSKLIASTLSLGKPESTGQPTPEVLYSYPALRKAKEKEDDDEMEDEDDGEIECPFLDCEAEVQTDFCESDLAVINSEVGYVILWSTKDSGNMFGYVSTGMPEKPHGFAPNIEREGGAYAFDVFIGTPDRAPLTSLTVRLEETFSRLYA